MNMQTSAATEEQLELFEIISDRPLPSPVPVGTYCSECMAGEDDTLAAWLRRQSEEQLHAIVDSLARGNGIARR
jgi:hypothetical protein